MTDAERLLWARIRGKQLGGWFNRQKPIGGYIVDFYCRSAKLVIEVDGSQHFTEEGIANDRARDEYLESLGLTVLRFTNTDVIENMEGVLERIYSKIPHDFAKIPLNPPLQGGDLKGGLPGK